MTKVHAFLLILVMNCFNDRFWSLDDALQSIVSARAILSAGPTKHDTSYKLQCTFCMDDDNTPLCAFCGCQVRSCPVLSHVHSLYICFLLKLYVVCCRLALSRALWLRPSIVVVVDQVGIHNCLCCLFICLFIYLFIISLSSSLCSEPSPNKSQV